MPIDLDLGGARRWVVAVDRACVRRVAIAPGWHGPKTSSDAKPPPAADPAWRLTVRAASRVNDSTRYAVHGMGGWLGTVSIGIFADETVSGGLVKASGEQFGKQLGAACGTAVYAFVVAFALIKVIQKFMVLLPPQEAIELGLDASIHGERAYKDTSNHGASAGGYARDVANPLKAATKAESQV